MVATTARFQNDRNQIPQWYKRLGVITNHINQTEKEKIQSWQHP